MRFHLPALPFNKDALAPYLTAEAIDVHYNGHHAKYVEKTNELLAQNNLAGSSLEQIIRQQDGELFNNAAQAWNHTFLWHGLCPPHLSDMPEDGGEFDLALDRSFGDLEHMKKAFSDCASKVFGSGYVWLVDNAGRMEFIKTQNADNPIRYEHMRPLWNCDLWEHAYYLVYRNKREEFVKQTWNCINWDFVENNFLHEGIPNMTKFMVEPAKLGVATGQHSAPVFD